MTSPAFFVVAYDLAGAAEAFDGPLRAFGLARRPWEQDHMPAGRAEATGWMP